ncbi:hypothetical protein EAO69_40310 [Streptomyces sp. me109]|nr:hypothetical protein EAO69_40310 [Streptomyces sp. me109]
MLSAPPLSPAHLRDEADRPRPGTLPFIHVLPTGRSRPVRDTGLAAYASAGTAVMGEACLAPEGRVPAPRLCCVVNAAILPAGLQRSIGAAHTPRTGAGTAATPWR